jgi:hypothetical protein
MSDPDDEKAYYAALGLSPDASLEQVKSRYRELNDAYLKILQLSKTSARAGAPGGHASAVGSPAETRPQPDAKPKQGSSSPQETHTEPISKTKARFAKGEIQKAQFEKLAKERYNYLKNRSFTDLSDAEFEERLHGFEGLKFL